MGNGKTSLPSSDRDFANTLKGMPCCFDSGCHDDLGVLFTGMERVEKTHQKHRHNVLLVNNSGHWTAYYMKRP